MITYSRVCMLICFIGFTLHAHADNGAVSVGNGVEPIWKSAWFLTVLLLFVVGSVIFWINSLRQKVRSEKILNIFATSLYGKNTVEDISWDVARNCIDLLEFEDCVLYQYDEYKKILVQKAACGPKNPRKREILNPIEIPLGSGIVGYVAKTRKAERIKNTRKDPRYIVDDLQRGSELAVPIIVDGKLFGVIDSEHSCKGFYTPNHQRLVTEIAAICAVRISRYLVEDQLRAKIARDLHDEMGSTLTSISIMSEVAMHQGNGEINYYDYFKRIKEYSSELMDSMTDIVWAINPANDTFGKMIVRMKELAAELLEPLQIKYEFKEEGDLADLRISLEQRKNVYLIYKEGLNNLVKYSKATLVQVTFNCTPTGLRLEIHDNGNGFEMNGSGRGNGLRNMHSRAAEMNATLNIDSRREAGTRILLQMMLT